MELLGLYHYWVFAVLLMIGFYAVVAKVNLVKKLIGLSVFQAAVFLLFISAGKVDGGTAPIVLGGDWDAVFSNPLPQVLILTAIVVGVATTAVGLALVVRIHEAYGTVEEDKFHTADLADDEALLNADADRGEVTGQ